MESEILSIPLREGLFIRIHGIPWDLTVEEAERISHVILAHAPPPPEGQARPVYPQGVMDNP